MNFQVLVMIELVITNITRKSFDVFMLASNVNPKVIFAMGFPAT